MCISGMKIKKSRKINTTKLTIVNTSVFGRSITG